MSQMIRKTKGRDIFNASFNIRGMAKIGLWFILPCLAATLSLSCWSGYTGGDFTDREAHQHKLPDVKFLVDINNDGAYVSHKLDREPKYREPQASRFKPIYPRSARESGTEGIVILDIYINEKGKVTDIQVEQGITTDIDHEAKRAFRAATSEGFVPGILNTQPVKCRMLLPIGFWVE